MQELVAACRNGDKSACEALVRAYKDRVFAVCLGILGNTDDAEDMAQETLIQAMVSIRSLRKKEQFGAWITRIAKNLCVSFVREQKYLRDGISKLAKRAAKDQRTHDKLQLALAKMPRRYRLPLVLYYFDGQSISNIAKILGSSKAAAQTRMSRARRRLRELLDSDEGAS